MSGPFGSSQWMYSSGFYPYAIDNSLRFNDDDSAYLSRTPASAGNRKTWTWSGWVKRGNLGGAIDMFSAGDGTTANRVAFEIETNVLRFVIGDGTYLLDTNALFRDASSWYHILAAVDTTQATASDRVSLYVNGTKITSFSYATYPTQNLDTFVNNTNLHTIGARYRTSVDSYFDGYLANIHFIDGTALDASSFGETKSGIWVAKSYSGSYGTNGFHLEFAGNVNDSSGNGNNWTANNISAHDYVPDSPTNNFAVLNAVDKSSVTTLAEGNLKATSYNAGGSATILSETGKYYWEMILNDPYASIYWGMHGLKPIASTTYGGYSDGAGVYILGATGGGTRASNVLVTAYTTWANGDIVGFAFDADAMTLGVYKNGTQIGSNLSVPSGAYQPTYYLNGTSGDTGTVIYNFGQDSTFAGATTAGGNSDANGIGDFKYAPPSGYLSLCTSNLPAPAIDPAVDDTPEDYFNTVLYTGNGSTQSITGVGFQPDWVWTKGRSNADNNSVFDVIRGVGQELVTNGTNAEAYDANLLTSFDSDGFSVGSNGGINGSGKTYVGWSWKAGGTAVSNTAGSITSQVSANVDAGFSIVSYTGNGTQDQTIGHGLTAAPEMIIVKNRDESDSTFDDWWVYHIGTSFPQNRVLRLNESTAELSSTDFWYNSPTSTVFGVNDTGSSGYTNDNTKKYIAYCFHSVEGYSKMGSYVGNGSTDGPFVYTGFRPAWVMIKQIDSVNDWGIFDIKRNTFNSLNNVLYPNLSIAELSFSAGQGIDAISNGFKVRVGTPSLINTTSAPYIYLAFAEQPLKYSNAR